MESFLFEAEIIVQDLLLLCIGGVCLFALMIGTYEKLDPIINK